MKFPSAKLSILLFSFVLFVNTASGRVETLVVASWNVENLFDTVATHPTGGDAEYTPGSWRRWTEERYSQKLDNLAWVIDKMKPDVLCMMEVENRRVVEDLVARIEKNHKWTLPHIAQESTADPRGIGQALISKYPITAVRTVGADTRRGMLIVTVDVDGAPATFVVNHWKSWVGDAETNIRTRTGEAKLLRKEMLSILKKDPATSLVIVGDFNEDIDGVCLAGEFKAVTERKQAAGTKGNDTRFYNLWGDIRDKSVKGSYYYARRKVWNTFDAIIVPPPMLLPVTSAGPDWRVSPIADKATKVFALPEMRDTQDGRPKAFRRVRIKNKPANYYEEGYADHFPVITTFRRAKAGKGVSDGR